MDEKEKLFIEQYIKALTYHMQSKEHNKVMLMGKGEGKLILCLSSNPKGLSPKELQNELLVGSGRIGNALKDLEKKGFIIRTQSDEDKRKTIVKLTEEGIVFSNKIKQSLEEKISRMYQALGEDDAFEFLRLMDKINQNLKKKGEENV